MRKFLNIVSNTISSGAGSGSSIFSGSSSSKSNNAAQMERIYLDIENSADFLSKAIYNILNSKESLQGDNNSGYENLITLLEKDAEGNKFDESGFGCLGYLYENMECDRFVEICNRTNIAESFVNAFRLLRMLEVKIAKQHLGISSQTSSPSSAGPMRPSSPSFNSQQRSSFYSNLKPGCTYSSATRVFAVFSKLIASHQTLDLIRSVLIHVFTFPLIPLPADALHLQNYSSKLVSIACTTGLVGHLVEFLRGKQLMSQMVKHLRDLLCIQDVRSGSTEASLDGTLKGLAAEQAGMWVIALECISNVITASFSLGAVLLDDLDSSGGFPLLASLLEFSSNSNLIKALAQVSRMFFDPSKASEIPVCFTQAGKIFIELLQSIIGLKHRISGDDTFEKLLTFSNYLFDRRSKVVQHEVVLQNFAYCLLTMYSNDSKNCRLLEDTYNYICTLLLAVPAMQSPDAISAVFTTLNYICQSLDYSSSLSITAMSVVFTLIADHCLKDGIPNEDNIKYLSFQLDICFSSFDAIIKHDFKYSITFMQCGLLSRLIYPQFLKCANLLASTDEPLPEFALSFLKKLVSMLTSANNRNSAVAAEVRKSGLMILVKDMVLNRNIDDEFAFKLILLSRYLGISEFEENLKFMIDLCDKLGDMVVRKSYCIHCISLLLLSMENTRFAWDRVEGKRFILGNLSSLGGKFCLNGENNDNYYKFLSEIMNLVVADMNLLIPLRTSSKYQKVSTEYFKFFENVSYLIFASNIFTIPSYSKNFLDFLVTLAVGSNYNCNSGKVVLFPEILNILVIILKNLNEDIQISVIQKLIDIVDNVMFAAQVLSESKFIRLLIANYHGLIRNQENFLGQTIWNLIERCSSKHLIAEDFLAVFYFLIRPTLFQGVSKKHISKLALQYGFSSYELENSVETAYMKFWKGIITKSNFSKCVIPLGSLPSLSSHMNPINICSKLNESSNSFLPGFAFSASCWFRVPPETTDGRSILLSMGGIQTNGSKETVDGIFQLEYSRRLNVIFVVLKKGPYFFEIKYNVDVNVSHWTSVVACYKKSKKSNFFGQKASVSLYINGYLASQNLPEVLDLDLPQQKQDAEISIGKPLIDTSKIYSKYKAENDSLENISNFWELGPFLFFHEYLLPSQVAAIYLKGHQYSGTLHSKSPYCYSHYSQSTFFLKNFASGGAQSVSLDVFTNSSGLLGYDSLVEPIIEPHVFGVNNFAGFRDFPLPTLAYNATNKTFTGNTQKIKDESDEQFEIQFLINRSKVFLVNSASLEATGPYAEVSNIDYIYANQSYADCIHDLGGPQILFPLLQNATSSSAIISFLRILNTSLAGNSSNLQFMHNSGYKLLGLLLASKSKDLISLEVIDAIVELLVNKYEDETSSYYLLVDTHGFYHLLLNHQIWDCQRYCFALKIVSLMLRLCKDTRFGILNLKKLSTIGAIKWTLMLCVFGVKNARTEESFISRDNSLSNEWIFNKTSDIDMADNQEEKDSFLQSAMTLLFFLISYDTRKEDLDLISHVILFSFSNSSQSSVIVERESSAQSLIGSVFSFNREPTPQDSSIFSSSPSHENSQKYLRFQEDSSDYLPPSSLLRVYLLRTLYRIYDEHNLDRKLYSTRINQENSAAKVKSLFRSCFDMEWFLSIFDTFPDTSTRGYCMRLIAFMIQIDDTLRKEIYSKNYYRALDVVLSRNTESLAVILPIFGLMSRIPIQMLPYPYQVKSSQKIMQLLELQECHGPDCSDGALQEFTLPLLSLFFNCISNISSSIKGISAEESSPNSSFSRDSSLVDILLDVLMKSVSELSSFQLLFQCRRALEMLCHTLISCSNAMDDLELNNGSIDLLSSMSDDYIDYNGEISGEASRFIDTVEEDEDEDIQSSNFKSFENSVSSIKLSTEGSIILNIISEIVRVSLSFYDNSSVLCQLLLTYPDNLNELFYSEFHSLIIENSIVVVDLLLLHNNNYKKVLPNISNFFTQIVSMARANLLEVNVLLSFLKKLLGFIEKLRAHGEMSPESEQRYRPIIADMTLTARCFIVILTQSWQFETYSDSVKSSILHVVRSKMSNILLLEENEANFFKYYSRLSRTTEVGSTILDSFSNSWGVTRQMSNSINKKGNQDLLALCVQERTKFSQIFIVALTSLGLTYSLDDSLEVSTEALKILCILLINHRDFMEHLFLEKSYLQLKLITGDYDHEIFEGVLKLLPPSSYQNAYSNHLCGYGTDSFGEERRFADFKSWKQENILKFEIIDSYEPYLKSLMPVNKEFTRVLIRNIKQSRVQDDEKSIALAQNRAISCKKNDDIINFKLNTWSLHGISYISGSLLNWRKQLGNLQCGVLWGYLPFQSIENKANSKQNLTLNSISDALFSSNKDFASNFENFKMVPNFKGWRLDHTEGVERTARKLEQVFFNEATYLIPKASKPLIAAEISSVVTPAKAMRQSRRHSRTSSDLDSLSFDLDSLKSQHVEKTQEEAFLAANSMENLNMEEFVKKMTQQGFIKRMSTRVATSFDDTNVEDGIESDLTPHSNAVAEEGSNFEVSETEIVSSSNENSVHSSSDIDVSETSTELAPHSSSGDPSLTLNRYVSWRNTGRVSKSAIISEILKGMIGERELINSAIINVNRISGLEAKPGLLIISGSKVHLLEGFGVKQPSMDSLHNPVTFEWLADSNRHIDSLEDSVDEWWKQICVAIMDPNEFFVSIGFDQIYSTFRRRYQLKYSALEISTLFGHSILFACANVEENENVLTKLLESKMPNNILHKIMDTMAFHRLNKFRGTTSLYNRVMKVFLAQQMKLWQNGEISNFEYLIHLNSAAGRSFQDLTQYPVFPWVLADYDSPFIDLKDPTIYRDLSKPMGANPSPTLHNKAAGEKRKKQFLDRYKTMHEFYNEGIDTSQLPFHYGTHYSCAGYVLNFLIRLQPYSDMAVNLQGGNFDKPDRLFWSIRNSWLSASQENLQDVRELTPEFFYLPEFLSNSNKFDFGTTQKGQVVDDVELPVWANNDPREFVRIHREALESKYVSENINEWIDLIFGYKQRGEEAVDAMNVFIHVTYEGEVDVDAIDDPVLRLATIAQINNFGQTPAVLFSKPHPKRNVPEILRKEKNWADEFMTVDTAAINWHSHLAAPFCVIGANHLHTVIKSSFKEQTFAGAIADKKNTIGDLKIMSKDKVQTIPSGCIFLPNSFKHYLKYKGTSGVLSFIPLVSNASKSEFEHSQINYEDVHSRAISAVAVSKMGDFLVTGSLDCSLRLWKLSHSKDHLLALVNTFTGHTQGISAIDISSEWNIIVSGGLDCSIMCWDSQSGNLRFVIPHHDGAIVSLSINPCNGNIIGVTATHLYIYSINGDLIAIAHFTIFSNFNTDVIDIPAATTVIATPCPDWMDGVVAVTGHIGGSVIFWKVKRHRTFSYLQNDIHSNVEGIIGEPAPESDNEEDKFVVVPKRSKPHIKRLHELYIAEIAPKSDSPGDICFFKLGSRSGLPSVSGSSKLAASAAEMMSSGTEDSYLPDLVAVDAFGGVTKYSLLRLDQVPAHEVSKYIVK